jgi:2,3-diketo-5-methylthio-1-phosphopentane phosphatase
MKNKLKIFCDFDGTIALNDTWMELGGYFIKQKDKWAEITEKFENLEIGARDCFLKECALVENFDINKFNKIIEKQQIDTYFKDFLYFCNRNEIPVIILSEGMKYYIEKILRQHNIDLPYFANKLVFSDDKQSIRLEFPNSDSECLKCGCCKRNLLLNMTADDETAVYIGDGFSDICVAGYADMVFAKKSLASFCWKNNITYFEFQNFLDIINKLEKIITRKSATGGIKQRQTAKFKRREVFLRG